jgi:hypothetical protein
MEKLEIRCYICNKKLSLVKQITNKCKCKYVFCDEHKTNHNCNFDYQKQNRDKLKMENQIIIKNTLNKI